MQTIQASEAKTHFLRILDDVERGESIAITRHGKEIAVISPSASSKAERAKRAFQSIDEIRKRTLPVSLEEILAARDEGRK
jgi:prevent-host-death family protein